MMSSEKINERHVAVFIAHSVYSYSFYVTTGPARNDATRWLEWGGDANGSWKTLLHLKHSVGGAVGRKTIYGMRSLPRTCTHSLCGPFSDALASNVLA